MAEGLAALPAGHDALGPPRGARGRRPAARRGLALEAQLGRGRATARARGRRALRRRRGPPRRRAPASSAHRLRNFAVCARVSIGCAPTGTSSCWPSPPSPPPPRPPTPARYAVSPAGPTTTGRWDGVGSHRHRAPTETLHRQRDDGQPVKRRRAGAAQRHAAAPRSPRPAGMTIADFTLTRQLTYRTAGRRGHAAGSTRSTSSAAPCSPARADYAERHAHRAQRRRAAGTATRTATSSSPRSTCPRARASRRWPATRGDAHDAADLRVGCFNGTATRACTVAAGGGDLPPPLTAPGSSLNDPTPPAASSRRPACSPAASATARTRSRSTPPTTAASARVEIVDVTHRRPPARRRRRGLRRPARAPTAGATCSLPPAPSRARTSTRETVRPTGLPAGPAHLKVRVIDAGGNVARRGPLPGRRRPRRRTAAPLNGSGATEDGTLIARCSGHDRSTRRPSATAREVGHPRPPAQRRAASRSPAPSCACSRATCRQGARCDRAPTLRPRTPTARFSIEGARRRLAAAAGRLALARQRHPASPETPT